MSTSCKILSPYEISKHKHDFFLLFFFIFFISWLCEFFCRPYLLSSLCIYVNMRVTRARKDIFSIKRREGTYTIKIPHRLYIVRLLSGFTSAKGSPCVCFAIIAFVKPSFVKKKSMFFLHPIWRNIWKGKEDIFCCSSKILDLKQMREPYKR